MLAALHAVATRLPPLLAVTVAAFAAMRVAVLFVRPTLGPLRLRALSLGICLWQASQMAGFATTAWDGDGWPGSAIEAGRLVLAGGATAALAARSDWFPRLFALQWLSAVLAATAGAELGEGEESWAECEEAAFGGLLLWATLGATQAAPARGARGEDDARHFD